MKFRIETSWQLGMVAYTLFYFEPRDAFGGEWVNVGVFANEASARKEAANLKMAKDPPKPTVTEFEL